MISHRKRESRRRLPKMTKNMERLFKEKKCRDCTVVVTRMDFAKILGKFTKVKIQFESSATPKTKKPEVISPNTNTRLKSNENGMVLIHRNAYHPHPVKELLSPKKSKPTPPKIETRVRQTNNILKENNRLKKTPVVKGKSLNISNSEGTNVSSFERTNINSFERTKLKTTSLLKQYGIMFMNPSQNNNKNDVKSKTSLQTLLPVIDKSILPSEDWCIEYLPIIEEPTDDKVYDRIAAELEDLMYNEKPVNKSEGKPEVKENKADEFPSIMDILNDTSNESSMKSNDQSNSVEYKTNLESSDVEAMLLGKSTEPSKQQEQPPAMEVDNGDMSKLIEDVARFDAIEPPTPSQNTLPTATEISVDEIENPQSPSILDEALQKGIEEHLPQPNHSEPVLPEVTNNTDTTPKVTNSNNETSKKDNVDHNYPKSQEQKLFTRTDVTHIIFKKNVNGSCYKRVTCPKNLKYSIELDGKHVELIGAPRFISSLEDLQVLLQIVNDTELQSLYILY